MKKIVFSTLTFFMVGFVSCYNPIKVEYIQEGEIVDTLEVEADSLSMVDPLVETVADTLPTE